MSATATEEIREFISDNFLFRDDRHAIDDTTSLLDAGVIDSTGILELVAFIESHFQVQLADEEIVPENLDSIQSISAFVVRKLAQARAAA
jgi:acyl carrier protein